MNHTLWTTTICFANKTHEYRDLDSGHSVWFGSGDRSEPERWVDLFVSFAVSDLTPKYSTAGFTVGLALPSPYLEARHSSSFLFFRHVLKLFAMLLLPVEPCGFSPSLIADVQCRGCQCKMGSLGRSSTRCTSAGDSRTTKFRGLEISDWRGTSPRHHPSRFLLMM